MCLRVERRIFYALDDDSTSNRVESMSIRVLKTFESPVLYYFKRWWWSKSVCAVFPTVSLFLLWTCHFYRLLSTKTPNALASPNNQKFSFGTRPWLHFRFTHRHQEQKYVFVVLTILTLIELLFNYYFHLVWLFNWYLKIVSIISKSLDEFCNKKYTKIFSYRWHNNMI